MTPPSTAFRAACVQMNATPDIDANIQRITAGLRQARDRKARIVALPENAGGMGLEPKLAADIFAHRQDDHPVLAACRDSARTLGLWVVVGSLAIDIADDPDARAGPPRVNRGFLIDDTGEIVACYDKIHLFDADPPGGERHRESHWYRPGTKAVIADTPWGKWGMTICYDLRFPALYRKLAQSGADIISVPSAFTRVTGKAHWRTLLRARAIENGCFILAPAQCGLHGAGRSTWGHSMIVDPWGTVLAEAAGRPTLITAAIDPARVTKARRALPALDHERPFPMRRHAR